MILLVLQLGQGTAAEVPDEYGADAAHFGVLFDSGQMMMRVCRQRIRETDMAVPCVLLLDVLSFSWFDC
jgi:hypothetical protein